MICLRPKQEVGILIVFLTKKETMSDVLVSSKVFFSVANEVEVGCGAWKCDIMPAPRAAVWLTNHATCGKCGELIAVGETLTVLTVFRLHRIAQSIDCYC